MPHSTPCGSYDFLCFSKGTSVPYSTPCGSYDFLCFSKGTSVPHSTPCGSYDFLCFSKGTSVPHSTPCGSYDFLRSSKGTSVPHSTPCGSYDFLCFSKGTSVPHSTPCGWTCRAATCPRPARPLKHRPVEGAMSRTAAATPDPSQCETVALSSSTTCRLRRIRTTTTVRKTSELPLSSLCLCDKYRARRILLFLIDAASEYLPFWTLEFHNRKNNQTTQHNKCENIQTKRSKTNYTSLSCGVYIVMLLLFLFTLNTSLSCVLYIVVFYCCFYLH